MWKTTSSSRPNWAEHTTYSFPQEGPRQGGGTQWFMAVPCPACSLAQSSFFIFKSQSRRLMRSEKPLKAAFHLPFPQPMTRPRLFKVAHVISFAPPTGGLVNMSAVTESTRLLWDKKTTGSPPKTGRSKPSLWVGCEVRVMGLKTA